MVVGNCIFLWYFKAQASKFTQRFHTERKNKLTEVLQSEKWKQADVAYDVQLLVNYLYENKRMPSSSLECKYTKDEKESNFIMVGNEKYAVVSSALVLVQIIQEYSRY